MFQFDLKPILYYNKEKKLHQHKNIGILKSKVCIQQIHNLLICEN